MALAREAAAASVVGDVPEPTVPSFLMYCKNAEKRPRMEQASTPFAAFQPSWGICESDTISGISELSMEWSRHSITPTDHATFIRSGGIDEAEILGANGLCIVSISYTSYVLSFVAHIFALTGLVSF